MSPSLTLEGWNWKRMASLVAGAGMPARELFAKAAEERGPFGDHLRYHLFRIYDKKELVECLRDVIRRGECNDERDFWRLRGAGLVRRENGGAVPRCKLYADFFEEHLK